MLFNEFRELVVELRMLFRELHELKLTPPPRPEARAMKPHLGPREPMQLKWLAAERYYRGELVSVIRASKADEQCRFVASTIPGILYWLELKAGVLYTNEAFCVGLSDIAERLDRCVHPTAATALSRTAILTSRKTVTAAEASVLVSAALGVDVSRKSVEQWGRRGKFSKRLMGGKTVYVLGDVAAYVARSCG